MNKPKNLSEEETLATINIVVNRIAPKYVFNGYDIDDIKQESFIICYEALNRYDNKRPLENFLSVNLSNRLKNFIRDNFGNAKDVDKKKVSAPATLSSHVYNNYHFYEFDDEDLDTQDIFEILEEKLPVNLREDFLKFTNNVYLNKNKKETLIKSIKDILNEER